MTGTKNKLWVSERLRQLFEAELQQYEDEPGGKRRVLDFFLLPGKVQAKVQDDTGKLHRIELAVAQFSEAEWQVVARELATQALFLASFLASRIPEEVESVLEPRGISLLPAAKTDIEISCNGEPVNGKNQSNAVVVLERLLERLDEDPFSIFVLRGKGREELLLEIRRERNALERPVEAGQALVLTDAEGDGEAEPIDREKYWRSGAAMNKLSYSIRADELPASLLKRLDPLPLGGLEEVMEPLLEEAYALVARRAQAYGLELQDRNGD